LTLNPLCAQRLGENFHYLTDCASIRPESALAAGLAKALPDLPPTVIRLLLLSTWPAITVNKDGVGFARACIREHPECLQRFVEAVEYQLVNLEMISDTR